MTHRRRAMASDLHDLVERAAAAPAAAANVEWIIGRARRLRRRSVMLRLVATALVVALVAVVYLSVVHDRGRDSVRIEPADSVLRLPPVGAASAQLLADGTPVWVVRHHNGTVSVLSAMSTHRPYGVTQLIG